MTPGLQSSKVIKTAKKQLTSQLKKENKKRTLNENEEHTKMYVKSYIKGAEMKDLRSSFKNWATFQEHHPHLLST
jgi:tRNA-dihydrouridine synthase